MRETIQVNSLHGQAIDQLAAGLAVEAVAPDGTIEAVRVEGAKQFCTGGAVASGMGSDAFPRPQAAVRRRSARPARRIGGDQEGGVTAGPHCAQAVTYLALKLPSDLPEKPSYIVAYQRRVTMDIQTIDNQYNQLQYPGRADRAGVARTLR